MPFPVEDRLSPSRRYMKRGRRRDGRQPESVRIDGKRACGIFFQWVLAHFNPVAADDRNRYLEALPRLHPVERAKREEELGVFSRVDRLVWFDSPGGHCLI